MEVLESNSGDNESGHILDCADGYINLSEVFFGCGGVHNGIFYQLVYIIVELHVHEDSMYYHATSRIYCHHLF